MNSRPVAIGARLKQYPSIQTLGFKPNFQDYSAQDQKLILNAKKIYYPTAFYADLFNAMGKETFPNFHTYKFAQDKIKQTAIFTMLGIPHPKTKIFYGKKQKQTILNSFDFPFIAKKARGSSKGHDVYLVQNKQDLSNYLKNKGPAYIQKYLPIDRDMRIIIIGKKIRLAYWRIASKDNFKTNLSQGGTIRFAPLPQKALDLALMTALKCKWDDVGIDIIEQNNQFYVLEGNIKYGTKGFQKSGINYKGMLANLIVEGKI
ncbi:MAG: ATP-grasp domain-containing protein [Desulfobacula sp.]|uniref:ATP-grasp domain-containing protein n=1 Tax=Desulfobacula sp. TaxID=2593537 RepID=UPI0025B7CE7F|nr:ATP-grasp domain-containing protein [Desulfobacula sp.]MCD4722457.1 ATP-grasp domain-containing protein [Desulfobacula sp.]